MTDVSELVLKVDSKQVRDAIVELRDLEKQGDNTEKSWDKSSTKIKNSNDSVSKAFKDLRRFASQAFGAFTIAKITTEIINLQMAFGQSMAEVQAISRATAVEMEQIEVAARRLGATTEYTAAQAAEAFKYLSMAGYNAEQSLASIDDVLNLATAGALSLGEAANISTNIMSGFGIAASNSARAIDVIAAVSSRANTDIRQLGDAMVYVGPVASAMGIDIGDAAAAVGTLSDAGMQAGMAGTSLRRMLSSLTAPTGDAAKAIERMGLTLSDIDPTANSIVEIIGKLKDANLEAADAFTIFGDRGGPAILSLVENSDKLEYLTEEMRNAEGEAQRMADTMRDSLKMDAMALNSALQELALVIGGAGEGRFRGALQSTTGVVRVFSEELGIFIGAISDTAEEAEEAEDSLADFRDVLSEIFNVIIITKGEFIDLGNVFTYWSERINLVAQRDRARLFRNWEDLARLNAQIHNLDMQRAAQRKAVEDGIAEQLARRLVDSQKAAKQAEAELQAAKDAAAGYSSKEAILAKLSNTQDRAVKTGSALSDEMGNLGDSTDEATEALIKLEQQLQSVVDKYDKAGAHARQAGADFEAILVAIEMGIPGADKALKEFYNSILIAEENLKRAEGGVEEFVDAVTIMGSEADPLAKSWEEALNRVDSAFVELWKSAFDGFRDFEKRLKDAFFQLLAELAHRATTQKILINMGFTTSGGGGVATGGGGGGFNLSSALNLTSLAKSANTLWKGVQGLATGKGLSGFSGLFGGGASATANMTDAAFNSSVLQHGLAGTYKNMGLTIAQQRAISSFAEQAGPILAGIAGAIQGWNSGNKMNAASGAVGGWAGAKYGAVAGAKLGSVVPGIGNLIGGAIGAVLGGVLGASAGASLFGTDYQFSRGGIELGFGESGFDPMAWERQTKKGGWFGSTKRRDIFTDLPDDVRADFDAAYSTAVESVRTLYDAIGVGIEEGALESVRIAMARIGTSGKSKQEEEEIIAQVEKWFDDLTEAMVKSIDPELTAESLSVLAASITSVNSIFDILGLTLQDISIDGAKSAKALIEVFEGIEGFVDASTYYYDNFYSEQEKAQFQVKENTRILAEFNDQFGSAIHSKNDMRAFVESLDMTSEAGRNAYLAAMMLAPSLVDLENAMQLLSTTSAEVAPEILPEGIEGLDSASSYYYDNFYSEQEKARFQIKENSKVLSEFNEQFGSAIQSKNDLRAFVESLDTTSEAGRNAYNAAMFLAPSLIDLENAMQLLASTSAEVLPEGIKVPDSASAYYYDNFYSEQEKARFQIKENSKVLSEFNEQFGSAIQSKDDLRAFVESLDTTSEAGMNAYYAAMFLAPSLVDLENAMKILGETSADIAWEVTDNLSEISREIESMFSGTYERIMLDGMKSEEERYNYFRSQADAIAQMMDHISDPSILRDAMREYDSLIGRAYGALGEGSQNAMRDEILSTMDNVRERAHEILGGGSDGESSIQRMQEIVNEMVETAAKSESNRNSSDQNIRADINTMTSKIELIMERLGMRIEQMPDSIQVSVSSSETN